LVREEWSSVRVRSVRALSSATLAADDAEMLNLKVKYRESFRPFAPAVLREHVADWFESTATARPCCSSPEYPERRRT